MKDVTGSARGGGRLSQAGSRARTTCGGESGQAMVEFALVIPVMLLVVFAAIQFGDAFFKWQIVSAAASEGARAGIVAADDADPAGTVEDAVRDAAGGLDQDLLEVDVDSTWAPGSDVSVRVNYPLEIDILWFVEYDGALTNTRTMRIE